MTKGVLLFAYNGGFDYITLAKICARRVKKYLDLPITLITDDRSKIVDTEKLFDEIVEISDDTTQQKRFYNGNQSEIYVWKNSNRVYSYDLTPYDKTLVIDVDYLISSDFLAKCLNSKSDFLIFKDYNNLSKKELDNNFDYISDFSIPFYWATVFIFTKSKQNKIFFELLKFIKDNWDYYRLIYQISETKFRNDFAFSIAIHIMSGYLPNTFTSIMPYKLHFVDDTDFLIKAKDNTLTFLVKDGKNSTNYSPIKVSNLDIHVMNKFSIVDICDE